MSPWEPGPRLLGNLYIIILGTLTTFTWKTWEPCREPWRNLEGTFWEPFGNLEGTLRNLGNLGNLEGTLREPWEPSEPCEPLLGNLYLGTFSWEPLLGNLYLGTFNWEPLLGNLYLGTFTWEPLLGNLYWEPVLGTWEPWGNRFWSCSGLLRNLYYGWRPQSILLLGNYEKLTWKKKSFTHRLTPSPLLVLHVLCWPPGKSTRLHQCSTVETIGQRHGQMAGDAACTRGLTEEHHLIRWPKSWTIWTSCPYLFFDGIDWQ